MPGTTQRPRQRLGLPPLELATGVEATPEAAPGKAARSESMADNAQPSRRPPTMASSFEHDDDEFVRPVGRPPTAAPVIDAAIAALGGVAFDLRRKQSVRARRVLAQILKSAPSVRPPDIRTIEKRIVFLAPYAKPRRNSRPKSRRNSMVDRVSE